jgi:hypothetical protein
MAMTTPRPNADDTSEDDLRQHAEPAAEGSDDAGDDRPDEPREHSEDPAEG